VGTTADDTGVRCSVVIPCHNGKALTLACVESLLHQDDPPAQIVLVDNGSTDGTHELDARDEAIEVVRLERNLGFAGGVNAGIRAATHPLVLVLNNDTQAATSMLSALHRALERDPRIAAAAPVSNHVKGPAQVLVGGAGRDAAGRERIVAELRRAPATPRDVDTLAGLCLLLRRAALDEIGLFDERFGHGNYEDDDFCLRLRLAGHRLVIAPHAFLHHEGHATFRTLGLDLQTELQRRGSQFRAKWRHDPAGRATLHAQDGELEAAGAAAAEAASLWPRWPDADYHLGRLAALRGDHAGAARHFESLLSRCPTHAEALAELALARHAQDDGDGTTKALTRLQDLATTAGQAMPQWLRRLGDIDLARARHAAAARSYEAALAMQPEDGELHNRLGLCRLGDGDHAAAAAHFRRAIEHGHALAHTNLGICLQALGDDDAGEHFAAAAELLPGDAIVRSNLTQWNRIGELQPTAATSRRARSTSSPTIAPSGA
jgi:GT2 family glycosyltransferase/Flp pilus assembly protein TadD